MTYEYEESNKQIVFTVDNESSMGALNERIKELQEVYRKAKLYDKLVELYPQKDEIPSDEFFMMMGYIIKEDD